MRAPHTVQDPALIAAPGKPAAVAAGEDALHEAGTPAAAVTAWLGRRGLPAAGNGQLLDLALRCASVWSALPRPDSGRVLLAVLAAAALNDPHALDRGSATATAVLRLLGHDLPDSAEAWRMAWEEHGIDCDPVSSRVLVLNLPLDGDAPCARLAQAAGPEPLRLTLRSLTGSFRMAVPASDVYVCENPSVLIAAADQLGKSSRPLVCTNGRPSAAALRLLTGLAESGTSIHVRADDDTAGQAIVATVRRAIPDAKLWRFEARPPGPAMLRGTGPAPPPAGPAPQQHLKASGEGRPGKSRPGQRS
jgi:uncharacterized protein (TIGR02679 family)